MNIFRSAIVLSALSIAACSGGGSGPGPIHTSPATTSPSGTPTIAPTATPTGAAAQYAARIVWTGGVNTPTPQLAANAKHRLDATGASPAPLLVRLAADVISNVPTPPPTNYEANATVSVSPLPSAAPDVTWAAPPGAVVLASPTAAAGATAPPAQSVNVIGSQPGESTITATIGSPVSGTQTLNVITLAGFGLECYSYSLQQPTPYGITFNADGSTSFTTSPAGADLYITGPTSGASQGDGCSGGFGTAPGTGYFLNAPSGISLVGQGVSLLDVTNANFVNPTTAIQIPTDSTYGQFVSSTFVIKTAIGTYVKFAFVGQISFEPGYQQALYVESDVTGAFAY